MRGFRIDLRGFRIHMRGCISCGGHILRGFYGVKVAVPAPPADADVEPSSLFKASNDRLDAPLAHACFSADPSDTWPAFTIVIGIIRNRQKDETVSLLGRAALPDA